MCVYVVCVCGGGGYCVLHMYACVLSTFVQTQYCVGVRTLVRYIITPTSHLSDKLCGAANSPVIQHAISPDIYMCSKHDFSCKVMLCMGQSICSRQDIRNAYTKISSGKSNIFCKKVEGKNVINTYNVVWY